MGNEFTKEGLDFPTTGKFELIKKTVEAMQYDGSMANAHEILAWVLRKNCAGYIAGNDKSFDATDHILRIDTVPGGVPSDSWVVEISQSSFLCITDDDFRSTYEPVPKPIPIVYRDTPVKGGGGVVGGRAIQSEAGSGY